MSQSQDMIFLFVLLCVDTCWTQQLPPRFPSNLYGFIPENTTNGSLITSFNVTDPNNDVITLGIYDDFTSSCVSLTETATSAGFVTGNIYLLNPDYFDYDRGHRDVRLAFTASDGASTVIGFVHIYASDVNDNAPEFRRPAYIFEIPETSIYQSTYNAGISAIDADDGVNSAFEYQLQSSGLNEGVFSIDQNNGNLTLNQALDYETLTFYQYTIKAVDTGTPSMTGSAEITIKVMDVQDTPPRFQGLPYIFTIKENSSWAGEGILAQDGDRENPRQIHYKLYDSECSRLFTLNKTSGQLQLNEVLDRDTGLLHENQGVCRFQIEAGEIVGPGEPSANSTVSTTVTVTVDDIDDNVPTFNLSHYNAYVDEEVSNIPLTIDNSSIGIDLYDLDQGLNSEFSLTVNYANGTKFDGIEANPSYIIGRATVLLRLVNGFTFDFETEDIVTLHVVATGKVNNSMTTTCTVTIYINNTNDNDPVFDLNDYSATIPENSNPGTPVVVVMATDADIGKYGDLVYTLKGSSLFAIDPQNGTIYTTGSPGDLDRETRDTYYLTVVVTDGGGKRAVASLTVTLSDVNDNWPEFISDPVIFSFVENTATLTGHIPITAIDADEIGTNNSVVQYRLQIPDLNLQSNFTINETTGELTATEPLDYENLTYPSDNGRTILFAIAYDLGIPSLTKGIYVVIILHDENDNTPEFEQDYYNAMISENSLPGHVVTTVTANDYDATSPNNVTRYFIEKGGYDKFRMNAVTGTITVEMNSGFDKETDNLYTLTVIASDGGTPPNTGTTTVFVMIDRNVDPKEKSQSRRKGKHTLLL